MSFSKPICVWEFSDFAQIFLFVNVLMDFWDESNVQKSSIVSGRPPEVARVVKPPLFQRVLFAYTLVCSGSFWHLDFDIVLTVDPLIVLRRYSLSYFLRL